MYSACLESTYDADLFKRYLIVAGICDRAKNN